MERAIAEELAKASAAPQRTAPVSSPVPV
jgi:hypothetical protein